MLGPLFFHHQMSFEKRNLKLKNFKYCTTKRNWRINNDIVTSLEPTRIMSSVQLQCVRGLHSTCRRNDFFSWFRTKKQQGTPVQDTKEVIKDIESGKNDSRNLSDGGKLKLIPSNFIGQQSEKLEKANRDQQVKNVAFNRWLSSERVDTEEQLDKILNESWQLATGNNGATNFLDQSFPDLVSKFKFTKNLQSKTGYMVPDFQITLSSTPKQLKDYYVKEILSGKLLKFKESEPNAIDLSAKDYGSPNVHIVNDVSPKEQKKKFGKILEEVHALEQQNLQKAVEGVKRG